MLPLFKVFMAPSVGDAVRATLYGGYITQGPVVERVEGELRNYLGVPNVLTVNSCTSALTLAYKLLGIEQGNYIITTALTCSATVTAAVTLGAKLIWADVNPHTGNIDPQSIEQRLEQFGYLPIKAIVPVHWSGLPCSLAEINALGNDFGIAVVEDAAHAFGAEYQGKRLGAHSDMVCYSYQSIKHVNAGGDGGLLVCKDPAAYSRGKLLRWFGIDRDSPKEDERIEQDIKEAGYKFHMNDVNATVLSENLQHADWVIERHRWNGLVYDSVLQGLPGITLLDRTADRVSSYWVYTLLVDQRDRFRQELLEAGIQCSQVHSRLDRHTAFRSSLGCDLPGLDEFAAHQISIPCHWGLTEENLDYISQTVKRVAKKLHA